MGKLIKNKALIKWAVFLFVLVPIAAFVFQTDFTAVEQELSRIGFKSLYIILITFSAYLLATWGWYFCLGPERKKIGIYQLFAIRQVGETVALYNPTSIVGGDLLKAELLKSTGISGEAALRSVVISRITAMLSQVLLFALAMIWVLSMSLNTTRISATTEVVSYAAPGLLILIKGSFIYWLATPAHQKTYVPSSPSFWKKSKTRILEFIGQAKDFFQQNPKMFWTSYALFAAHWIVGSMEFYLILRLLGQDIHIVHGLLMDMSVIIMKSLLAFVPGQIGIEELANKLMLDFVGIPAVSIWITVSILRRSRQLFWIGAGFILYLMIKNRLRHIAA